MNADIQYLVRELYPVDSDSLRLLPNAELRSIARRLVLSGYSSMNKGELVTLITTAVTSYYNTLTVVSEARQERAATEAAMRHLYSERAMRDQELRDQQDEDDLCDY